MQIQFENLVPFIQSHPVEMATGMITAALVTAAVQRSSIFENSPVARSAFSAALGITAGAGAAFSATQSALAGKLLFTASAAASIGFLGLSIARERSASPTTKKEPPSNEEPVEPTSTLLSEVEIQEVFDDLRSATIGRRAGRRMIRPAERTSMRIATLWGSDSSAGHSKSPETAVPSSAETTKKDAKLQYEVLFLSSIAILAKLPEVSRGCLLAGSESTAKSDLILRNGIPRNFQGKTPIELANLFSQSLRPLRLLEEFVDDREFFELDHVSISALNGKLRISQKYDLMKMIFPFLRNVADSASEDTIDSIALHMVPFLFGDLEDDASQDTQKLMGIIRMIIQNQEELFSDDA